MTVTTTEDQAMTNVSEDNKNWGTCPNCGEPVLVDPTTGDLEPCGSCVSHASKGAGAIGMALIIAGIAAAIALVYLCIHLL